MADLVLSSSSVGTWLDCHLQWYFKYVLQLDGDPSEPLETGIAVHEHIEALLTNDHGGGVSVDPDILSLVDVWLGNVLPDLGEPQYVEEQYRFEVNGIDYQSTLDIVDEWDVVIDTKTTRNRPRAGRYRIPLIGHALGFRALTGRKEKGRRLDYLVRTKTPYYWPEEIDGPATIDDIAEFGAVIEATAEGIDQGEYAATGLDSPYACATCPFRAECGPRIRYEEGRS